MSLNLNSRRLKARVKVDRFAPCNNGACAHYVMVSRIQWKPFWLATQLYPPNDRTGWQKLISVNYDAPVFAKAPLRLARNLLCNGLGGGGGGGGGVHTFLPCCLQDKKSSTTEFIFFQQIVVSIDSNTYT